MPSSEQKKKSIFFPAFIFCFLLLSVTPAHAYLDPGAGSLILQVLLGGIAALGVVLKLFWHRILDRLGIERKDKENTKSDRS